MVKDILCNNCSHKHVCSYKDTYNQLFDELSAKVDAAQKHFSLKLECNEFLRFSPGLTREIYGG